MSGACTPGRHDRGRSSRRAAPRGSRCGRCLRTSHRTSRSRRSRAGTRAQHALLAAADDPAADVQEVARLAERAVLAGLSRTTYPSCSTTNNRSSPALTMPLAFSNPSATLTRPVHAPRLGHLAGLGVCRGRGVVWGPGLVSGVREGSSRPALAAVARLGHVRDARGIASLVRVRD